MYALVDCNNFYVSCERAFNPKLAGKPCVVMSNNDGCAVSRSNEAKQLGIKMGQAMFLVKDLIKKHGIICCSSNYTLYGDMSQRVMSIYERFTPNVEVYSIDEAFLKFRSLPISRFYEIAERIKETVVQWTGIPVSVGFGATKSLAKIANKLAKKSSTGIEVIDPDHDNSPYLEKIPVEDVWGVGRQHSKWLWGNGIFSARQLRDADEKYIRDKMTVVGQRIVLELRGTPCIPLELQPPDKKSVCYARSFGKLLETCDEMREAISHYASEAAFKLRKEGLIAENISVFIETNPFREQDRQYQRSACLEFPIPTNASNTLVAYALRGLERIFKAGYKYKKSGVLLTGLVPQEFQQQNIFMSANDKETQLMTALDAVNKKHGRHALNLAGGSISEGWKPKFLAKSRKWTTQWDEIPVAYAHSPE